MPATKMDLREYLAGQALSGLLASPIWNPARTPDLKEHFELIVEAAAVAADLMVKKLNHVE